MEAARDKSNKDRILYVRSESKFRKKRKCPETLIITEFCYAQRTLKDI